MVPKFLILHGWLRGNLGSFCITRRLVLYLRETFPDARIDLVSMPMDGWEPKQQMKKLVNRYMEHHFSEDLSHLFPNYTAVLNAPGGGLQTAEDARTPCILRDASTCNAIGVPYIFSSHSFHTSAAMDQLRGSLIIAREPTTFDILKAADIAVTQAADLAFLEPMPVIPEHERKAAERTLLVLRFNHFQKIELNGRTLTLDDRTVELPDGPLMLGTSDPYRDSPPLSLLSERWKIPFMPSYTLEHLLEAIGRSKHVISDRCHPTIFSQLLGVPCQLIQNEGNSRDIGIQRFMDSKTNDELAAMARYGLETIGDFLKARL